MHINLLGKMFTISQGAFMGSDDYRIVDAKGVAVAIISNGKILLFKRRSLPFLKNAGVWSLLFGHKEENESYMETAYRETREESGIERKHLRQLCRSFDVELFDRKRGVRWRNRMFIFRSDTSHIKKDFENAAYRWASLSEMRKHIDYTNIFIDEAAILKKLSRYIDG
jgi:8-oxo-dGTP pyrophosphatase MutT (NUDIX family)